MTGVVVPGERRRVLTLLIGGLVGKDAGDDIGAEGGAKTRTSLRNKYKTIA